MRFLVDECTGLAVARWLREQQHDLFSVYEEARGMSDEAIIRQALAENRVLIANDKDFGEKVYHEGYLHRGNVLLRLEDERASGKIAAIRRLLDGYGDRIVNRFVVVTDTQVRLGGG